MWTPSETYSVHERPQGQRTVHAASRDDDVGSQIQAAADGRGPGREGGVCLQEHAGEGETGVLTPGKRSYCGAFQVTCSCRRPPLLLLTNCSSDTNGRSHITPHQTVSFQPQTQQQFTWFLWKSYMRHQVIAGHHSNPEVQTSLFNDIQDRLGTRHRIHSSSITDHTNTCQEMTSANVVMSSKASNRAPTA